METKHVELLKRLEQFQLDSPEASLPFSARLAHENNWSMTYTRRVIEEYKRFTFLAVAAGHPVSPSDAVDQAWHLHLTYTQNYWKVFCAEVLQTPFHHHPTKGGAQERGKFDDWYVRTLESYRKFFGEDPPRDIWPHPADQLASKPRFVRVDKRVNWVIPKPSSFLRAQHALLIGLPCIAVLSSGAVGGFNPFDWNGPSFLMFYVVFAVVCLGVGLWMRRQLRQPVSGPLPAEISMDGYAMAYLNGGKALAVNVAIANLANQKAISVNEKGKSITVTGVAPVLSNILERVVYSSIRSGGKIGDVRKAAAPIVGEFADELKSMGALPSERQARLAVGIPLCVSAVAVLVGIAKILIGISRDKPVFFLILLCVLTAIVAIVLFAKAPLRSRHGDSVLELLKMQHGDLRTPRGNLSRFSSDQLATSVGLFGLGALAGSQLGDLETSLNRRDQNGGSSCGGGCGGGDGGGGCGGCGGGGD